MTSASLRSQEQAAVPKLGGINHIGLTVPDVEASEAWYARVLGLSRLFVERHHQGTGQTIVLHRPEAPQFTIGLDRHDANQGERFDECRTGLDHVAFQVADRAELDAWKEHLDREGVPHAGITERTEPFPYAVLVFRDPDNIQLELIWY